MLEQAVYAIGAAGRSEQDYAQQLLTRLQCAINQRNWALFGECFTENVLLVNLLGQRLSGRAELKVYLQQLLELHQDRCLGLSVAAFAATGFRYLFNQRTTAVAA